MEFFNTNSIAGELESLSEAIATMKSQLSEKSLFGIATLILELFEQPDIQSVRVAVTEQQNPNMFEDMVGEERWLHCSVTVQPGDRLLNVPPGIFPAHKLSEGLFEAQRTDPLIQETFAMWRQNQELARLRLAQHLRSCFRTVLHRACVNVITQRS